MAARVSDSDDEVAAPPEAQEQQFTDADILNVMVSTDNHLGFMERDPVRGNDSFAAFEEVLAAARDRQVDLVLLAGDLFHENKPTRYTMYRTMEILRSFVFGYAPVCVQVIGKQAEHFGRLGFAQRMSGGVPTVTFNRVNWEDPHMNIALPIFSIHGNHDDPSADAGAHTHTCALDVLAVAGMVNYFGRQDAADAVTIAPVLMVKNKTKLALYGLGSMRDERFIRLLIEGKVKFRRPAVRPNDWFSVFLIHQNRDNRSLRTRVGSMGAEACLPSFLDLVIWGHEHECMPDLVTSVATSLSEGESRPKHCFLLRVRGQQFKIEPIRLRCVRPFFMKDIDLAGHVDVAAPDAETRVSNLLRETVTRMIEEAEETLRTLPEHEQPPRSMSRPLLRLKVEHTGFNVVSNQRFGTLFAERVANPADILLFWRRHASRARSRAAAAAEPALLPQLPADNNVQRLEDIVMEQLRAQQLTMLEDDILNHSLKKFVEGDSAAIKNAVDDAIQAHQSAARRSNVRSAEAFDEYLEAARRSAEREPSGERVGARGREDEEATRASAGIRRPRTKEAVAAIAAADTANAVTASAAPKVTTVVRRIAGEEVEFEYEDEGDGIAVDDEELLAAPVHRGPVAASRRAAVRSDDERDDGSDGGELIDRERLPARSRPARAAVGRSKAAATEAGVDDEYDDDDAEPDDDDEDAEFRRAKTTRRSPARSARGRGTRGRGAAAAAGTKRSRAKDDDDDEAVDLTQESGAASAASTSARRGRGGVAKRGRPAAPAPAASSAASAGAPRGSSSQSERRKLPWEL